MRSICMYVCVCVYIYIYIYIYIYDISSLRVKDVVKDTELHIMVSYVRVVMSK